MLRQTQEKVEYAALGERRYAVIPGRSARSR